MLAVPDANFVEEPSATAIVVQHVLDVACRNSQYCQIETLRVSQLADLLLELGHLLVLNWRITVALIASTMLALALAFAIPPFTGPYAIALALCGLAVGCWWHSRALAIRSGTSCVHSAGR
ncbi:hypothetical protein [Massilia pseudoviolaceinigra]|uniref:hypothetical protein n=1 Tax=Massilia pseudoviolaceinigra TaxID=3057165 RepID=UPI002796A377|nr:hypothetical protein [Massilia sp. CCM 9206]MDQ1919323.1 hypothetical protein [Massilia sp. CCM 9206]